MKLIFAGTPLFAVFALEALCQSSHEILGVYTTPDRQSGRGQRLQASPVKQCALQHHLRIFQPQTLRDIKEQQILRDLNPDAIIVSAYGFIFPKAILDIPRYGCINIHPSLLPRWRGAAPIHRALLSGDKETGVTIMQMAEGLDSGDRLYQVICPIENKDNIQTLHDKLARLGATCLLHVLDNIQTVAHTIQDEALVTYAAKLSKTEAALDWQKSAKALSHSVRGFYPAYSYLEGKMIKIWEAEYLPPSLSFAPPGTILEANHQGIAVLTGKGILRLQKLQLPGKKPLPVKEILNGHADLFAKGKIFSATSSASANQAV